MIPNARNNVKNKPVRIFFHGVQRLHLLSLQNILVFVNAKTGRFSPEM